MQNLLNHSDILSRRQASEYMGICRASLDRLNLPRIKVGRRVLYKRASLQKWLSEHEVSKEASL
jgi:hypothetical protein